ncbi:MAG: hypothetical protein ACI8ZM_003516 [Crocinitomix sp.]|jgi:hypothetical protein
MGFFQKIKSKLGIGGVKIQIDMPGQISITEGIVNGKFTLTTKSDQEIKSMEVKLIERYTTGRGDDAKTKEFTLGSQKYDAQSVIKAGEQQVHAYNFPFELLKSSNDELAEKGGALGGIGKLGKFAKNEKSEYVVEVDVDVKAAAIDPSEEVDVKLV